MTDVLFLINALDQLTAAQTTAALIAEAARRARTWVAEPRGLVHTPGGVVIDAVRVHTTEAQQVPRALRAERVVQPAATFDGAWIRLNPGRAQPDQLAGVLETLLQLEDAGVPCRNAPGGLLRSASKLYLCGLPADVVPPTWCARDLPTLRSCIEDAGNPAVVKPALGTRGEGVHRITPDTPELDALLEGLLRQGPVLVQAYLPEAPQGDVRIHLVEGRLLTCDGAAAMVRRIPASGEWRSNVALGGTPEPAVPTPQLQHLIERVGPVLAAHGLWHVGLDVVGDRVVECNVFSPGGLTDARRFTGQPFEAELVERFLTSIRGGP